MCHIQALVVVVVLLTCIACKGKREAPPTPTPVRDASIGDAVAIDAVVADSDWKPRCKTALTSAAKSPSARRPREIIDGCRPCGDWAPLLRWDIRQDDGGPSRDAIEQAMEACNAYCSPSAKQRFLATLDDARGKNVRTPWRHLGELCGEAVSAKPDARGNPDTRYMSAAFFALDRIARAAATDRDLAGLMAAVEVPLPPVGVTGDGMTFPMAPVTKPEGGRIHVTLTDKLQHAGTLPRAKLTGTGVFIEAGEPYPGPPVETKQLAAALATLAGADQTPITIIAPSGLAARRIAETVVTDRRGTLRFVLAAEIRAAPHGWSLLGHVPVTLLAPSDDKPVSMVLTIKDAASVDAAIGKLKDAKPPQLAAITIAIGAGSATTVELAKLLGALAYRDIKQVFVLAQ